MSQLPSDDLSASSSPTPESPTLSTNNSPNFEEPSETFSSSTIYLSLPNSRSSSINTMTARTPDNNVLSSITVSESNDSGSASSIPVLTEENFSTWLMSIEAYFTMKDLDGILDGSERSPADPNLLASYNKRCKQIAGMLILKLSDRNRELLVNNENKKDPALLWSSINNHYASTEARNQARVFTKLFSLKCSDDDLGSFISSAKKILNELSAIGVKTDDSLIAFFLLYLLPDSMSHVKDLVIHGASITNTKLTVDAVLKHLQNTISDKKISGSSVVPSALSVKQSTPRDWPICSNGVHNTQTAHTEANCWQLHPETKAITSHRGKKSANSATSSQSLPLPPAMTFHLLAIFNLKRTVNIIESLLDSGASVPMFAKREFFKTYSEVKEDVTLADGTKIQAIGSGSVVLRCEDREITLSNCLHIPTLTNNLVSLSHLYVKGCQLFYLGNNRFEVRLNGSRLLHGSIQDGIFILSVTIGTPSSSINSARPQTDVTLLHRRLGHLNDRYLRLMVPHLHALPTCSTCLLCKHHRLPFAGKIPRPTYVLQVVHSDLSGRISPASLNGGRYYLKFTNGFSKFKHIFILQSKSEAFSVFKNYKTLVENQTGCKIKRLVNDGGGEYMGKDFKDFLTSEGIIMDITAPYTPQQNPISERGNRTTTERARCMLIDANLPKCFWAEAVNTAVYIENLCPEASINHLSPHELWYGTPPRIDHLRIFGCSAYRLIPKQFRGSKFNPTSQRCILLGYQERMHNYRLFDLTSRRIIYSHDVIFNESDFSINSSVLSSLSVRDLLVEDFDLDVSSSDVPAVSDDTVVLSSDSAVAEPSPVPEISVVPDIVITSVPDSSVSVSSSAPNLSSDSLTALSSPVVLEPSPISLGKRKSFSPPTTSSSSPAHEISSKIDPRNIIERRSRRANVVSVVETPKTFKQAMRSPTRAQWIDAVAGELDNMARRGVWTVVELPPNCRAVGTVWVFKTKLKPDGELLKHKARLCAQGFSQIAGLDFNETYAPTGSKAGLRLLLAIAAALDLDIESMDAIAAFLNGIPDEEIYLKIPEGLSIPNCTNRTVLKVNKSIYGLKQSPRCWYKEICAFFLSLGFKPCLSDPCLFIKNDDSHPCFVHVHVDDLTIAGTPTSLASFKAAISSKFEMEDLGPIDVVLGIKISRNRSLRTISLSQEHYVTSVLATFYMEDCKPVATPMEPGSCLTPASEESVDEFSKTGQNFRQAVGCLNYLVQCTRPDLAFSASQLSQHLERPGMEHWSAFKRVLRYLKQTSQYCITYRGSSTNSLSGNLTHQLPGAYADADWAGDKVTRRSTSGYVFTMFGGAVSWRSKKQAVVSLSTTEAEYKSTVEAGQELAWLEVICSDLQTPLTRPITLYNDNQGAIALSNNPVFQARSKHIETQYHWIREKVLDGVFKLVYVATGDMLADICTKALPRVLHERMCRGLGLLD